MKQEVLGLVTDLLPFLFAMFCLMIVYVVLQLILEHQSMLDELMFYICILAVIPEILSVFKLLNELTQILSSMLLAFIPIIGSIFLLLQGPLSLLSWNPIVVGLLQFLLFIVDKLLVPLAFITMLIDIWTRSMPELPLSKLAQFIRNGTLIVTGISMLILTSVMTVSGTLLFTLNDAVTSPIKRVLEQSIPLVGSMLVQAVGAIKKAQIVAGGAIGATAIITFVTALSIPLLFLVIRALSFKLLSIISEPLMPARISGFFEDISKTLFVICGIVALVFVSVVIIVILLFSITTFLNGRG